MQKCAYERFSYHSQRSFTEQQISLDFFDGMMLIYYAGLTDLKQVSIKDVLVMHKITLQQQPSILLLDVPDNFDGLGLFTVNNPSSNQGISKTYDFVYKPIQEMLAALHLTTLKSATLINELSDTFRKKDYDTC